MEEATTSTVLLVAKIGAMIGLGFGSLLLGMLPLIVGRYRMNHCKKHCGIFSNSSTCTSTSVSNASSASVISGSATSSQVRFES